MVYTEFNPNSTKEERLKSVKLEFLIKLGLCENGIFYSEDEMNEIMKKNNISEHRFYNSLTKNIKRMV